MWELDHKESWGLKNRCFWSVVLEKTLESPLDCKEIQPVHPKGDQSWVFIGRTGAKAEASILLPLDMKTWPIWKDLEAGKDWRQEEKGTSEDEMVGWHHELFGHEFEQTLGVGDGQGSLACCSPWRCKESDMTKQLNWTELKIIISQWDSYSLSLKFCMWGNWGSEQFRCLTKAYGGTRSEWQSWNLSPVLPGLRHSALLTYYVQSLSSHMIVVW